MRPVPTHFIRRKELAAEGGLHLYAGAVLSSIGERSDDDVEAKSAYFTVIDSIVAAIDQRFTENDGILRSGTD